MFPRLTAWGKATSGMDTISPIGPVITEKPVKIGVARRLLYRHPERDEELTPPGLLEGRRRIMKLNRGLLLVTMMVGAVAVTGCSKSDDEGAAPESATTEMASATDDQGATQTVASADEGFTEYARGGGRGGRGGGRGRGGEHRGGRGGEHRGARGGEGRGGEGRGGRGGEHRAWWHFWG